MPQALVDSRPTLIVAVMASYAPGGRVDASLFTNFEWPLPKFYELPSEVESTVPEPASLTLMRGQTLNGTLTRFLPAAGVIEYLPARGRANIEVPFADVKTLKLTRPLRLKPRRSELEQRAGERVQLPEKLPFKIDFTDGDFMVGETVGFDLQSIGLFLFVQSNGSSVLRAFIPSSAIGSHQIGKPLGELLLTENLITQRDIESGLSEQRALRSRKLGDILTESGVISVDELHKEIARQRKMPMKKLGAALIELGLIREEHLAQALERQKGDRNKPLGEILVERGHITQQDLLRVMTKKLGIPSVDLKKFRIDPDVVKLVPDRIVREHNLVPLCMDGAALVVAMENPLDPLPIERIRFLTQGPVVPVMASCEDIARTVDQLYPPQLSNDRIDDLASQLVSETTDEPEDEGQLLDSDSTLVRMVNAMILDAHAAHVSDIHVETNAGRKNVTIRFRKDGVLQDYLEVPASFRSAIVSRLKIMAGLDIAERRIGQDGRIKFGQFGPARLDLRIATIPTQNGLEDVVLRLLYGGEPLPLNKLGLRESVVEEVRKLLTRPYGLILVCGPTGSGKTTTLHSLLGVLNSPERKIWTAEDPVEITQPRLRQVQVNPRAGWTFAAALRSFLRGDPDVIMVGEMRDAETASMAIEGSLTGHVVLSTLHTNSAPETVVRLLEMGMDPFSFADSLTGVLAQRLARKLCDACKTGVAPSKNDLAELAKEYCYETSLDEKAVVAEWRERYGGDLRVYHAPGCDACKGTGHAGRIGLHELLVSTQEMRPLVRRRAPADELRELAIRKGMRTLKQDGIEKCLAGMVDLPEVRAVAA